MAGTRDHRMCTVGFALAGAAGVNVHVSHHRQSAGLAERPELSEITAVEPDDTAVEAMGIEIVIEYEIDDPGTLPVAISEQKGATLSGSILSALTKPPAQPPPQKPGN